MGRESRQVARASLGVIIAPSRVRRVARGAAWNARRSSKAPRRARTGALDLRGASIVNGRGVPPHASGIPPKTSGCSPRNDGSCRSSSGSQRRKERRRRHRQGCCRSWDCSSRSSQSGRASLCRRSPSSEGIRPHGDGCSIHSDRCPPHSEGRLCQHRRLLDEIEVTPWKKPGQLYRKKATPYADLEMLCSKLGMLSRFAGMLCAGEDGIREESRDPRAVLPVPSPSRQPRHRREGRPSPLQGTLRAHLGPPSMGFETPHEKRMTRTVKLRSPCRRPPSLQRFLLKSSRSSPLLEPFSRLPHPPERRIC